MNLQNSRIKNEMHIKYLYLRYVKEFWIQIILFHYIFIFIYFILFHYIFSFYSEADMRYT